MICRDCLCASLTAWPRSALRRSRCGREREEPGGSHSPAGRGGPEGNGAGERTCRAPRHLPIHCVVAASVSPRLQHPPPPFPRVCTCCWSGATLLPSVFTPPSCLAARHHLLVAAEIRPRARSSQRRRRRSPSTASPHQVRQTVGLKCLSLFCLRLPGCKLRLRTCNGD